MNNNIQFDMRDIEEICRKWKISKISLFGSILSDSFSKQSDIDMLLDFEKNARISLLDLAAIEEEFSVLFNREVDIVCRDAVLHSRNPIKKASILNNSEVLYAA